MLMQAGSAAGASIFPFHMKRRTESISGPARTARLKILLAAIEADVDGARGRCISL